MWVERKSVWLYLSFPQAWEMCQALHLIKAKFWELPTLAGMLITLWSSLATAPDSKTIQSWSIESGRMAASPGCLGYALRARAPSEVTQEYLIWGNGPLLWASELSSANQFPGNFTIKYTELCYIKDTVSYISSKTLFHNINLIQKCAKILQIEGMGILIYFSINDQHPC